MNEETNRTELFLAFVEDKETQTALGAMGVSDYGLRSEIYVGGIKEAVKFLKNHRSPRVLLIDVSSSNLPISDMLSLADACEPGVEVIAIGARNEVGIFRDLISLGVKDYLVKPLLPNHFTRAMRSALGTLPDDATNTFVNYGKIIAVVGTRGGVGVSSIAQNCAWNMATTHGKRIGLVDLDTQMGVQSVLCDLPPTQGLRELLEFPDRIDDLVIDRSMSKMNEHLFVFSSEESLSENFHITSGALGGLAMAMKKNFHYTLFDLPRTYIVPMIVDMLRLSDIVFLVTDLTLLSVRDTARILRLLKEAHTPNQRVIVICNKKGLYKKGEIKPELFEESLEKKIDCFIDFDAITPLDALNQGEPIVMQNGVFGKGIQKLTELIIGNKISMAS